MKDLHICRTKTIYRQWGNSITYCYEDKDSSLWTGNEEYESQVNFCPFCGYEAINKIKDTTQPSDIKYGEGSKIREFEK